MNDTIYSVNQLIYKKYFKGDIFMGYAKSFADGFFTRPISDSESFFDDIYDGELYKGFDPLFPADTEEYSKALEDLRRHISGSCGDPSALEQELSELSGAAQKNKSLAFRCGIKAGLRFAYEIAQIEKIKAKLKI